MFDNKGNTLEQNMPLMTPLKLGARTVKNRIAINAMECCDADEQGNPTDTTYKRYENLFKGGAGVVIAEAFSVIDESKGRLHQPYGCILQRCNLIESAFSLHDLMVSHMSQTTS